MEVRLSLTEDDKLTAQLAETTLAIGHGRNSASPNELLLSAVAGCSAAVFTIILRKKRITYDDLTVEASLMENHKSQPTMITGITLTFTIKNPSKGRAVLDVALNQAVNNCPLAQSLKDSLTITETLQLVL